MHTDAPKPEPNTGNHATWNRGNRVVRTESRATINHRDCPSNHVATGMNARAGARARASTRCTGDCTGQFRGLGRRGWSEGGVGDNKSEGGAGCKGQGRVHGPRAKADTLWKAEGDGRQCNQQQGTNICNQCSYHIQKEQTLSRITNYITLKCQLLVLLSHASNHSLE